MALSTSWSLALRAPSTASKPAFCLVKAALAWVLTTHTAMSSPPAKASESAVTTVDSRC